MAAKKKDDRKDRLAALAKVAGRFSEFKPASEVLTNVRSVPTIFPQVDTALRTGGWPIERIGLVHGPSTEGKTLLVLGLGLSFLKRDHFFAYCDAEYTTTDSWLRNELLHEYVDHPGFSAIRPRSYEHTRDSLKQWVSTIGEARAKGDIDDETTGLCVIDSIKALVPERIVEALKKDAEEGKIGLDGMSGRAGQYMAALNGALTKEFVPLCYHAKVALVLIGREGENTEKTNPYDNPWKLGGGKDIFFNSSVVARVSRSFVKEGDQTTGERHRVMIYKSKVAGKEGKYVDAFFHTSNGSAYPAGFDLAPDVLEMAVECGVVAKKGGTHYFTKAFDQFGEGEVLGNSEAKALQQLRNNPEQLASLEAKVRDAYTPEEKELNPQPSQ